MRSDKVTATAYRAQMPPTLPVRRDKPKRALIVALGLVLGGAVGVLWILMANALRQRRGRQDAPAAHDVPVQGTPPSGWAPAEVALQPRQAIGQGHFTASS